LPSGARMPAPGGCAAIDPTPADIGCPRAASTASGLVAPSRVRGRGDAAGTCHEQTAAESRRASARVPARSCVDDASGGTSCGH
jgi:hypothetical protein